MLRSWIPEYKLSCTGLCRNPNAVHLLEQNPDKINWHNLSANPAIFEEDYACK